MTAMHASGSCQSMNLRHEVTAVMWRVGVIGLNKEHGLDFAMGWKW